MPMKHPGFVQDDKCDSVAEFKAFVVASQQAASHLLAELARLQTFGDLEDISAADYEATAVSDLYCRKCDGWAVFYRIDRRPRLPMRVTVVLVGRIAEESFEKLEAEAAERLARWP
jgi:hypothetical protein